MSNCLIIIMGVSGCGKTSISTSLAETYDFHYMEADDFHSEEAKAMMARGQALNDKMRQPWIQEIKQSLIEKSSANQSTVLSFSGLRRAHREAFRNLFDTTLFLHLVAPYDVILDRMNKRTDHFMPPTLLESQFAALEPNLNETDIVDLDARLSITQLIEQASQTIDQHIPHK